MTIKFDRYEQVVTYIASKLETRWPINKQTALAEDQLYLNTLTCILSSQVSYELAQSYAAEIARVGRKNHRYLKLTDVAILNILKPRDRCGNCQAYRFPNSRTKWIVANQHLFLSDNFYLRNIFYSGTELIKLREWLTINVAGIGLKQASMLINMVFSSDQFAILDRHILRYLHGIGLLPFIPKNLSTRMYYEIEDLFIRHANFRGYRTDLFDHATWIAMRSFGEIT